MRERNKNRENPSFANINILGRCNIRCYFCIGNEINTNENQLTTPFKDWKNFDKFLLMCKEQNIEKVYLTGLNTDPALYKYLEPLIVDLINQDFKVGIRTNGYTDVTHLAWFLNDEISYSVHSLNPDTTRKIIGTFNIPNWDKIIPLSGNNVRIAIVVNRYNILEIADILKYFSQFENIKYIQLRNICSDYDKWEQDNYAFEALKNYFKRFTLTTMYKGYPVYKVFGKEVSFWDPLQVTINSINYFTDGTITDNYFVTEGYRISSS